MALTCGPGLSAAEGAAAVEAGSAAVAVISPPEWAGPGRKTGKEKGGARAGGCWAGAEGKRPAGRNEEGRKKMKKPFSFFSINFPIPFLIPILFEILIDTKHSQNNMQRHECTYMLLLYDKF